MRTSTSMADVMMRLLEDAPEEQGGAREVQLVTAGGPMAGALRHETNPDGCVSFVLLMVVPDERTKKPTMVDIHINPEFVYAVVVKSEEELPSIVTPPTIITPGGRRH